jgi:hypothetical protein
MAVIPTSLLTSRNQRVRRDIAAPGAHDANGVRPPGSLRGCAVLPPPGPVRLYAAHGLHIKRHKVKSTANPYDPRREIYGVMALSRSHGYSPGSDA